MRGPVTHLECGRTGPSPQVLSPKLQCPHSAPVLSSPVTLSSNHTLWAHSIQSAKAVSLKNSKIFALSPKVGKYSFLPTQQSKTCEVSRRLSEQALCFQGHLGQQRGSSRIPGQGRETERSTRDGPGALHSGVGLGAPGNYESHEMLRSR